MFKIHRGCTVIHDRESVDLFNRSSYQRELRQLKNYASFSGINVNIPEDGVLVLSYAKVRSDDSDELKEIETIDEDAIENMKRVEKELIKTLNALIRRHCDDLE